MKTTIKLSPSKSLTVEPCKAGGIIATLSVFGVNLGEPMHITTDQCGALMFGIERAIEAQEIGQGAES